MNDVCSLFNVSFAASIDELIDFNRAEREVDGGVLGVLVLILLEDEVGVVDEEDEDEDNDDDREEDDEIVEEELCGCESLTASTKEETSSFAELLLMPG